MKNDCFADDAVEDAEEIDTPLSLMSIGGRPLCSLRFADDIDLLGGSWEEEQLTERLEKQLLDTEWKSATTDAKFSSTASSQDHLPNIWMNGKAPEEVDQFKYLGSTKPKRTYADIDDSIKRKRFRVSLKKSSIILIGVSVHWADYK